MLANIPTSDIDLWSDEVLLDPAEAFTALREQSAAVYLEKNDVWVITRYQEIRDTLGDWQRFSSNRVPFNPMAVQALRGTSLTEDPPTHTALRAALTENLSPRAMRRMKDEIDQKADAIVARLVEQGSFEGIDDLAAELPIQVVLDLIGVQGSKRDRILPWGFAAFNTLGPENARTFESFPVAGELHEWSHNIDPNELAEGSIGRALFDAAARGEIEYESCGKILHQYLAAGMDTTIAAIGYALKAFGEHPEQWQTLRDDPSLIPSAFNESLRYEALMHVQGRNTTSEVVVDGTVIPADAQLGVLFWAGNRDPRHYEEPDVFRIERNPVDHLSFGYGPHACAGQGLAKLEAHAVLSSLVKRVKSFEVGEAKRKINNSSRPLESVPVLSAVAIVQPLSFIMLLMVVAAISSSFIFFSLVLNCKFITKRRNLLFPFLSFLSSLLKK